MIIASSAFRHATRFCPEAERGLFSISIENRDQINYRSNRIIGRFVELARFNARSCNADA